MASTKDSDLVLPPLGIIIGQIDYATDPTVALIDPGSQPLAPLVVADKAGEVLSYTTTISNTGTDDFKNVVVTVDDSVLGTVINLGAGSTQTFTPQYQVKQGDIDSGALVLSAKVTDDQGDSVLASKNVPVLQLPGLSIVQTVDTVPYDPRNAGVDHALQVLSYTVSVTNTGNETLTGLTSADGHALDRLDVGKTWTYTSKSQVTQADVDKGDSVANTATVTDDQGDKASTTTTTPVTQHPDVSIILLSSDQTTVDHAGEVINFTAIEANTGNVTLTSTVTDKLNGQWTTLDTSTLVPSQGKFLHFSYTVTQADMDAGLSIGALVEAHAPGVSFGDETWKQFGVGIDQKATVNVENLESFDGGQTWYFHQMPGFATQANVEAALRAAGGSGTVVGYTTAPNVKAGTAVLQAALVTDTGNVTDHQLSVRGFTFDASDLAPNQSMLSHVVSTTAGSSSGTYTNSVSVSGNHLNSYGGFGIQIPFGLTSNTDTASYSVGDVVSTNTISVSLGTSQPSFVAPSTSDPLGLNALTAQVQADLASAQQQIQAATNYINSLPPLPALPLMPWQTPTSTGGSAGPTDLQSVLQSLGLLHS